MKDLEVMMEQLSEFDEEIKAQKEKLAKDNFYEEEK